MTKLQETLAYAEARCTRNGGRLTQKRKHLLSLLLSANRAMSAYEISDLYQQTFGQAMPAMSVYRILDFLEDQHLVHKLASNNKFIACSEMKSENGRHVAQFLICDSCHRVEEIELDETLGKQMVYGASQSGFQPNQPQLEISGFCRNCKK